MSVVSQELIAAERRLLARVLAEAALAPRELGRRELKGLRKVSQTVERTWVSAGCFGEAVQWRLKPKGGGA